MGEVYRAKDQKLGREVAIKVLPDAFGQDPVRVARFEREARAAAALNHPNICAIHEIGEHEGQPFIVMELIKGQTLEARLLKQGRLECDEVLELSTQLADALMSHMPPGSFIATSSRQTSSSRIAGRRRFSISAWPKPIGSPMAKA
jgi:serine/threonine protein kinase